MPYLDPVEFSKKHETANVRIKGKQYGGHCTDSRRMRTLSTVLDSLSRCKRDYTIENANCDMYHQRVVKVAGNTTYDVGVRMAVTSMEFGRTPSELFTSGRFTSREVMGALLVWLGRQETYRQREEQYQKSLVK